MTQQYIIVYQHKIGNIYNTGKLSIIKKESLEIEMTEKENFKDFVKILENENNNNDNIFDILGASNWEIRHSKFLAWLLNPNASHGLNSLFLEKVLKQKEIEEKNFNDVSVTTELCIEDKRRIDIFIKGDNFTITIENKYGSCEHDGQLKDYKERVKGKYPKKKNYFIYLDLYKPKDFDKNNSPYSDYKFLSYKDIYEILNEILKKRTNDKIKMILGDYIKVLDKKYGLIQNEEFIKEMQKISDYGKFIEHVVKLKDENLSSKEKETKYEIIAVKNLIQNTNNSQMQNILDEIIKKDGNDISVSPHSDKNNYGVVIRKKDKEESLFPQLRQIDYTSGNGLKICMHAGFCVPQSRNLIQYIENEKEKKEFFKKLNELDKNWSYEFWYRVRNNRKQKGEIAKIVLNLDEIVSNKLSLQEFIGEKEKTVLDELLDKLINYQIGDNNMPNLEENKKYTVNFVLSLVYTYPNKIVIDDDDKENLKKTYIIETRNGLEVFGKAEEFSNKILSDEAKKISFKLRKI